MEADARTSLDGRWRNPAIFGERAEAAVRAGKFPREVVKALDESLPCGAGRGIRLVTKNRRDVAMMLKLAAIKLAN